MSDIGVWTGFRTTSRRRYPLSSWRRMTPWQRISCLRCCSAARLKASSGRRPMSICSWSCCILARENIASARGFLTAEAAINLQVMFLLEEEIPSAAEFFAQKFADILRRHRIIYGKDVLASLKVSRHAAIFRLRQILLNLVLRLRESFASRGHRPEQAALILVDTFGPLRAASATLLELEGAPNPDASAALTAVAASFGPQSAAAAAQLLGGPR